MFIKLMLFLMHWLGMINNVMIGVAKGLGRISCFAIASFIIYCFLAPSLSYAQGTRLYVKPTSEGSGNGSSWANATTLSAALTTLSSGGEIWMARGTYSPGTTRASTYDLPNGIVIYGGFAGTETSLPQRDLSLVATTNRTLIDGSLGDGADDTDNIRRLIELGENEVATLDGLAIANAYNDNSGGDGAAIFADDDSDLTLRNCRLENNVVSNGGSGGALSSSGTLNILTTVFSNNRNTSSSGGEGGAVFAEDGTVHLLNSVFIANTATDDGGALSAEVSTLIIVNTVFRGNSATSGGKGGGVYVSGAETLLVANSIFFNNSAAGDGNHLEIASPPSSRSYRFRNNIIEMVTRSSMRVADVSLPTGESLEHQISATNAGAVFASADNTSIDYYKIGSSSAAVNMGTNDYINGRLDRPSTSGDFLSQTDVFGGLRLSGTVIDIGAHEYKPPLRVVVLGEEGSNVPAKGGVLRVRVEIGPPHTSWLASTTNDFVSLAPSSSQMADGLLLVRFGANTGAGRRATVVIRASGGGTPAMNTLQIDQRARGNVLRVTSAGTGNGSSWTQASSLSAALSAAGANDTIWVAKGTYSPGTSAGNSFALRDLIHVYGGFAGTETSLSARDEALIHSTNQTILDGEIGTAVATDNINRMFNLTGNNAVINGLSIRNCYSTAAGSNAFALDGGAVFRISSANTYLEINNCIVEDNSAVRGTVVFADFGVSTANVGTTVRLINSVFKDNTARTDGGGVLGAGIALQGFSLVAKGCRFEGNSATAGGALYVSFPSNAGLLRPDLIEVDACVFLNNSATGGSGGAIQTAPEGIATDIRNSVFAGNTASLNGGALYLGGITGARPNNGNYVVNCTFFNNTATSGVGNAVEGYATSTLGLGARAWNFAGCIFWSTAAGSSGHNFITADQSLYLYRSIMEGGTGGIRSANSPFGETANLISATAASTIFASTTPTNANYLRLKAGSPAIDAARGEFVISGRDSPLSASLLQNQLDAAGNPRYVPGGLDLGAYEYQTSTFPLQVTTDPTDAGNLLASSGEVIASIDIGSGVARWRASTNNSFLMLMPTTGVADGDLTISYSSNSSSSERVGEVRITAENAANAVIGTADVKLRQSIVSLSIHTLDVSTMPVSLNPVPAAMGQATATITVGGSAEGWSASVSSGADFLSVTPASGNGNGTATIRYMANSSADSRTGEVTIMTTGSEGRSETRTLSLMQLGAGGIVFEVVTDPVSVSDLPYGMGRVTVNLSIVGDVTGWGVSTTSSLLRIMPASGMGNTGTFTIDYPTNATTSPRNFADITIASRGEGTSMTHTLSLGQVASPPPAGITVSQLTGGSMTDISAKRVRFTFTVIVSGSATGWDISAAPGSFLTPFPTSWSISSPGMNRSTFFVDVPANGGGRRQGSVTIRTRGGVGRDEETLSFSQLGAGEITAPTLALSSTASGVFTGTTRISGSFNRSSAGSFIAEVTAGGSATGWRAISTNNFLTVTPSSGPAGSRSVTISYAANTSGSTRTAQLRFETVGGQGPQDAKVASVSQSARIRIKSLLRTTPADLYELPSTAGSVMVSISQNDGAWSASESSGFLNVMPSSGTDAMSNTTSINYTANTTGATRSAEVTFSVRETTEETNTITLVLRQLSASSAPTLRVNTNPIDLSILPRAMGQVTVSIDVGGSATGWSVAEDLDYLSVSPASGNGDGTATITYLASTVNTVRRGLVTVSTTGGMGTAATWDLNLTQLPVVSAPTLDVTPTPAMTNALPGTAGRVTANIDIGGSADSWGIVVMSGADFVTISPLSGSVDGSINIDYTENLTGAPRTAEVVISTRSLYGTGTAEETLTLTQTFIPVHTLGIVTDPTDLSTLSSGGGTVTTNIVIGGGATNWNASVRIGVDFMSLAPASGGGNGSTTITYLANITAFQRTGSVVITTSGAGRTVTRELTLTQAAATPSVHTLGVVTDPTDLSTLPATMGEVTATMTIGGGAAGWAASVMSGGDFLSVAPASGMGNGPTTISYTANTGTASRTGTISIRTTGAGTAFTRTLTLTQAGSTSSVHTLGVVTDPTDLSTLPATMGEVTATLTIGGGAAGWAASVMSGGDFLSVAPASGMGNGPTTISYTANTGTASRMGTISIRTTGTGTVFTRTLTLTQAGSTPSVHTLGVVTDPTDLSTLPATMGEVTATLTIGGGAAGWAASVMSGGDFLSVAPASGMGNGPTTISYTANTGTASRMGTISIRTTGTGTAFTRTLTLTQAGSTPSVHTLGVVTDPTDLSTLPATMGEVTATLTIGGGAAGWAASVMSGGDFLSVAPASGMGNGPTTISYTANTGTASRMGTISIRTTGAGTAFTRTLTLTQAGSTSSVHTLGVVTDPTDLSTLPATMGEVTATLTIGGGAAGWAASVMSGGDFLSVAPASGMGNGPTTISYTANTGTASRMGTISIRTTGTGTAFTRTLTLTQAGSTPSVHTLGVMTDPTDLSTLPATMGEVTATLTIGGGAAGWAASVMSGGDFLSVTPASGMGNGPTTISYTANTGTASRMGTISIRTTGTGTAFTRTLTLTQAGSTSSVHTLGVMTDPTDLNTLPATMGEVTATLTIGGGASGWAASVTSGLDFLSVAPASGMGNGPTTISYTANTGTASRMGEVSITTTGAGTVFTRTLTLTQLFAEHTLEAPTTPTVTDALPSTMGEVTANLTIGGGATGWNASVASGADFLTVMPASGMESGATTIGYSANTSTSSRTGEVTITTTGAGTVATKTITLTQVGQGAVSLTITTNPPSLSMLPFSMGSVRATINIVGPAMGWSARKMGDFLTITPASGTGMTGTLTITYEANTGLSSRSGDVIITTTGATNNEMTTLRLTQAAAPAPPSLTAVKISGQAENNLSPGAGNLVYVITLSGSATGWSASASSAGNFLSLDPSMGSSGGRMSVRYTQNTGSGPREGRVIVTATGGSGRPTSRTIEFRQLDAGSEGNISLALSSMPADLTRFSREAGQFTVSIDIEGNGVSWSARSSNPNFLTIRPPVFGSADGAILVNYSENQADIHRDGRIIVTLTGRSGVMPIEEELRVTQLPHNNPFPFHVPDKALSEVRFNNPARDFLDIRFLKVPVTLRLYTLSGRLTLQMDLGAGNHRIPLDKLSSGIYLLRLYGISGSQPGNYTSYLLKE